MIYAIGDIHGCYLALTTLFKQLARSTENTYIFLGDYVDKGPDSRRVLDWLINFSKENNAVFIQGNHEIMMLAARIDEDRLQDWQCFGGEETLMSYGIKPFSGWDKQIDPLHWEFISKAKPYHQIDHHLFVHAGLEPGILLPDQNRHYLFWKKYETPEKYDDEKKVICGHTSRKNGIIANFNHTVCIDTYAHGGQWLTALNVLSGEFWQANQKGNFRSGALNFP